MEGSQWGRGKKGPREEKGTEKGPKRDSAEGRRFCGSPNVGRALDGAASGRRSAKGGEAAGQTGAHMGHWSIWHEVAAAR